MYYASTLLPTEIALSEQLPTLLSLYRSDIRVHQGSPTQ